MSEQFPRSGWVRLPNGYDVEMRHGIPSRVSDNGRGGAASDDELTGAIRQLSGLDVRVGEWGPGEAPGEREAPVVVAPSQFGDVLRRLARASAALFVDRYHKPIDRSDVDWDSEEYAHDFNQALRHCGLGPGDVDRKAFLDDYLETMHRETRRLVTAPEGPIVESE